MPRFFQNIDNSRRVRGVRRPRLASKSSRVFQPGFALPAMVESLEQRQLLSNATVQVIASIPNSTGFQGTFNVTLNGVNHPALAAGQFDNVHLTPAGASQYTQISAYCVGIDQDLDLATAPVFSATVNSTTVYGSAGPSGNASFPGYITALSATLTGTGTNAIAWLIANEGPSGDAAANETQYALGMALQAAIWHVEYEAPVPGTGWSDNAFAVGTHLTLNSISPRQFNGGGSTIQADFQADYKKIIDDLNAVYTQNNNHGLDSITPGALYINLAEDDDGAGETDPNWDQPLVTFSKPITIGDFVWNDVNGNGIQNSGEAGINGVTLTLTGTDGAGNSVTDHTTTSGNGAYLFTEAPGTYTVTVDASNFTAGHALAGYLASPTLQASDRTVDSNPNPSGTTPGTLAGGSSDLTVDFGYYQPVTIGDFVWNDLNDNGVQDAGEPGISGVTLTITGTTGAGVAVSQTTTTDASGHYSFTEAPGTYSVAVTTPAGYVPTVTGKGTAATDSNPSPSGTTPGTLASGGSDQTIDFGFLQTAPKLSVTKTADAVSIAYGTQAGYTVTITNSGNSTATGVTLSDPLPGGAGSDINWSIDGSTGNPSAFTISGSTGSQTLSLKPNTSIAAGASLTVHVTGTTTQFDLGTSTNASLGLAGQFAVLYFGDTGKDLHFTNVSVDGPDANVGVGGTGTADGSGGAGGTTITGNVEFSAPKASPPQWNSVITSGPAGVFYNVANVSSAISTLKTLSSNLGSAAGTNIAFSNTSQAINISAGTPYTDPVSGVHYRVFTVTSYSANNSTVNTINGDAAGDMVVFNFKPAAFPNGNINFGGTVALNGLTSDQVIWNVTATSGQVSLSNNGGAYYGDFLVPGSTSGNGETINFNNDNLYGRVFGGDSNQNMQIVSGAHIHAPATTGTLNNTATVTATNESGSQSATATITITAAQPMMAAGLALSPNLPPLFTPTSTLLTGQIGVLVSGLTGPQAADELARINDALGILNTELGPFNVHLNLASGAAASSAAIHISVAATSPLGSKADGVLGATSGQNSTILSGWNWYVGANPAGIRPGQYDFVTVATHELAHALGLGESTDPTSVMYPQLAAGKVRRDVSAADLTLIRTDLGVTSQPALPPGPAVSSPIGQPGVLTPIPVPSEFVVESDSQGKRNVYWLGLTRKTR
jgi:uncharacterized repeat protein (TIGR01451 family)